MGEHRHRSSEWKDHVAPVGRVGARRVVYGLLTKRGGVAVSPNTHAVR